MVYSDKGEVLAAAAQCASLVYNRVEEREGGLSLIALPGGPLPLGRRLDCPPILDDSGVSGRPQLPVPSPQSPVQEGMRGGI